MFNKTQPGRLICAFSIRYDSITWQPATIPTEHLGVPCHKGPSALPFVVLLIYEESMYKQEPCWIMLTYTCEGQHFSVAPDKKAPEINWTTWVFLPKYEWNIFKPSKNGVFACLLYMMTRENNPTAEKKGPVQHAQFRSCGEPFQITCLAHRADWRILLTRHSPFTQLVRRKVSIK